MKNSNLSIILKGLIKENPVLVLILGTCPTLAISTSVVAAFGMGMEPEAYMYALPSENVPSLASPRTL